MMKITHKELVKIGADWLLKKAPNMYLKCQFAVTEFVSASNESPDIFGIRSGQSVLVEVKISRSDFLADKKKHFRQHNFNALGQQRYYLVPKGLVSVDEVGMWGLLEYADGKIAISKTSAFFETQRHDEMNLMYSLIRRVFKPGLLFDGARLVGEIETTK